MASLRPPGLGPIIGHTSDTVCRVWIRAGDPADDKATLDKNRRTVGVIGILGKGKNPKIEDAWYFRLTREFDRTGAFLLGADCSIGWYDDDFEAEKKVGGKPPKIKKGVRSQPLNPDTEYTVRVGTLTLDDPLGETETLPAYKLRDRLPDIDVLKDELLTLDAEESEAVFRTFPKSGQIASQLSFILGSCRYPGLLWKVKEADRIFGPIAEHFDSKDPNAARFIMMCGDQIYADALNKSIAVMRADTYQEFQERYVTAFSSRNLRALMRRAPTYMILDDHEIEDNWTQDRINKQSSRELFNLAISAYMSYQWSHSPHTFGRLFYYAFGCAGYPVFVLDTRTQRFKDDQVGLLDNHMLGRPSLDIKNHPSQLDVLLNWLAEQQATIKDAPKFIVSSSVFAPNDMTERVDPVANDAGGAATNPLYLANVKRREESDSWPAYPNTRAALLAHIVQNKIQNVIFLGGDIHCSCLADITFNGAGKDLRMCAVTSSAFYWPFPFADGDPNGYVHDSQKQLDPFPVPGTDATMNYTAFGFTQEDNFTRLEVDRANATLTIRVFDRKGEILEVANEKGNKTKANVLKLAKW